MKLQPVAKPDKKFRATSKKFDDDAMSENFDAIVIFPILARLKQLGSRVLGT